MKKWKKPTVRKVNVNRALQPYAQRYICKMKYAESVTVTTGGGTNARYAFNLNSIFDPNRTGTGHQPYGHDQAQTIYNRYRVIGCKWAVSVSNISNTIQYQNCQLSALPANTDSGFVLNSEIRENPRARYLVQSTQAPVRTLTGYVDIKSLMGRNKSQYMADDNYQAQFGASPSELAVLNIQAGNLADLPETQTYAFMVELVYTVECFDGKVLPAS